MQELARELKQANLNNAVSLAMEGGARTGGVGRALRGAWPPVRRPHRQTQRHRQTKTAPSARGGPYFIGTDGSMNTRSFLKPGEKPPEMPVFLAANNAPEREPGHRRKPPPLVTGKD
jgi:hypothetical protein